VRRKRHAPRSSVQDPAGVNRQAHRSSSGCTPKAVISWGSVRRLFHILRPAAAPDRFLPQALTRF
jgi:hypothetical protein